MLDVRDVVSLAKSLFGGSEFVRIRIFWDFGMVFQVIVKLFAGRMRSSVPFGSFGNRSECLLGLKSCRRRDADKLFFANRNHIFHRFGRLEIDRRESRAIGWCSKDSAVEHVRARNVGR